MASGSRAEKENLFDSSDEDNDSRPSETGSSRASSLKINQKYARHFDTSRRKMELVRAKHLGLNVDSSSDEEGKDGSGSESESSLDTEDEEMAYSNPLTDMKILRTI